MNMKTKKINLGVLVSGNGSNLQALIDHIKDGSLNAEIKVVISDNIHAYGLERAKNSNIPQFYIEPGPFKTKLSEEAEEKYIECLKKHNVQLVCLAGFMRIIKTNFLENFPNRIINIHPSLLPAFPGLSAQRKALEYGVKFAGCTVHFVNSEIDNGPIITQAVVPVLTNDTENKLRERILKEEHRIYTEAINSISDKLI